VNKVSEIMEQMGLQPYTEGYYSQLEEGSRLSARVVVPLVLELVQARSVIDVGCGTGDWLSVFQENGVTDIWGIDGAYVDRQLLKIPQERFVPADLKQPIHLDRTFDLVASLEVAEHLSSTNAEIFVNSLAGLGPVVLFSAAIPYQGGDNHVNEQWPEYWVEIFKNKGYIVVDALRRKIWNNEDVQPWYAQNVFLFVAEGRLKDFPLLGTGSELQNTSMLSLVHPQLYLSKVREATLKGLLQRWHSILVRAISHVLSKLLPCSLYRLSRSGYRLVRTVVN
jgi:SAM-dependent methyltransferase